MAPRARSPVLGYNHNLRHGGRVFHVQTEDSGQGYARLYTHLFYQGTILSSKKEQYDPAAPEDAVRAAMQKLHKLMITELTHAEHDERIAAFFSSRGEPATLPDPAPVSVAAAPPEVSATAAALPPAAAPVAVTPAPAPKVPHKPVVVVQPAARRPSVVLSNAADGVVVRRNVVINVGAGQPPVHGSIGNATPPPSAWPARARAGGHYSLRDGAGYLAGNRARAAAPEAQPQPLASARDIRMPWETPGPIRITAPAQTVVQTTAPSDGSAAPASGKIRMPWDAPAAALSEPFADDMVSDKSLDEVILEYLADDGETDER